MHAPLWSQPWLAFGASRPREHLTRCLPFQAASRHRERAEVLGAHPSFAELWNRIGIEQTPRMSRQRSMRAVSCRAWRWFRHRWIGSSNARSVRFIHGTPAFAPLRNHQPLMDDAPLTTLASAQRVMPELAAYSTSFRHAVGHAKHSPPDERQGDVRSFVDSPPRQGGQPLSAMRKTKAAARALLAFLPPANRRVHWPGTSRGP